MKKTLYIAVLILLTTQPMNTIAQSLKKISRYELWWAITHPFVAPRAFEITRQASQIATAQISNPRLDGDYNGGQVDAFRHTLWMALLVQEISPKAARKLGIAHEKANYLYYKRHKLEDGSIPDYVSSQMDLLNNEVGIDLGITYKGVSTDTLIQLVILAVVQGRCFIIKKNQLGDFLDENNQIISSNQLKGKWLTPKVIVRSDYIRPKI